MRARRPCGPVDRAGPAEGEPPRQDNDVPFDEKAWRRKYMRLYMQKRRERMKAGKDRQK